MRLLRWSAEKRYQSAAGLLCDFEELLSLGNSRDPDSLLEALYNIESLQLSDQVPSSHFNIPTALLRRGPDLKVAVNAMESVQVDAKSRAIFVAGSVGIGKTAFLFEAEKYSIARRAFWVQVNSQDSEGVPYFTIKRLLDKLAWLLSELDADTKERLRNSLTDNLGGIGKLLTNLVPSLVV